MRYSPYFFPADWGLSDDEGEKLWIFGDCWWRTEGGLGRGSGNRRSGSEGRNGRGSGDQRSGTEDGPTGGSGDRRSGTEDEVAWGSEDLHWSAKDWLNWGLDNRKSEHIALSSKDRAPIANISAASETW